MTYRCVFPNCQYETDQRSLIEFHHIHPKELGCVLNKDITIPLCPTHHKMIYHPGVEYGQHSIKHQDSLSVEQVTNTSHGMCVIFNDVNGKEITVHLDTRPTRGIRVLSWSLLGGIKDEEYDESDESICLEVDRRSYIQLGLKVYYLAPMIQVARDLLKNAIATYMTTAKSEYELMLERARADYKSLRT